MPYVVFLRTAGLLFAVVLLVACTGPTPDRTSGSSSPAPGTRLYHVQLQITEDKDQAVEILGRGQRWWTAQPPADRPSLVEGTAASAKAVSITWKAPYYRVRLGPFATEAQAEAVLEAARSASPDAFVVPDRVEAPSTTDEPS